MTRTLKKSLCPAALDPEEKSLSAQRRLALLTGVMLALAGCGLGAMNLYFGTGKYKLDLLGYYLRQPLLLGLNLLPFVLLILLLWLLCGRAWLSFALSGAFTLFYSWAEYWKLMGRSEPIYAEDLTIIKEGVQMGVRYAAFTWQIVLSLVLVVLGALVFFFFFRGRLPRLRARLAAGAGVLALSVLLFTQVYLSESLYQSFQVWQPLNQWLECNRFISRGCIYPFLYSTKKLKITRPEGYSKAAAEALLGQYSTDEIPEDRKVNVVMVMFEAFADLSADIDAITGADPYAAYHALRDESFHGQLVTNVFAGSTIITERGAVTGFSRLTSFRRASWSFARYFADQSYAINGSHPGYEGFYSRRTVNENLGLEPYYYLENHYGALASEGFAQDRELLPEILRLCREDLRTSDYVFSFNVTYQNHGPYSAEEVRFDREYVPQGEMDRGSYIIANNYLAGVADTGTQMLALADELREDEAPYVLVFFGDHKPWLGDQNSVYRQLGIDVDSQSDESFYRHYGTEYLIWANEAAREKLGADFTGAGPTISPCFLMNQLFALCGWEGPSFLKLSNRTMERTPVVTTNKRFVENGALCTEEELSEEARRGVREMQIAQFYLMRDSGGSLPAAP